MGRHKTTGETTRSVSLRLNPAYDEDRAAIEHLDDGITQGYSSRQTITDALCRAAGYTPEMFSRRDDMSMLYTNLESLLSSFAAEIMKAVQQRGGRVGRYDDDDTERESGEDGLWVRNFARGFIARQQQALGEDEE
ncbi:MAG TPA: hypothetical protein VHO69_11265 [Phototrophicaceae bacterium]|nr:hypothetical protein [Phototrophicaceae bacterium]